MEGNEKRTIETTEPRPEELSDGVSFAEIARAKQAKKANGAQLDNTLRKIKYDKAHIIIGSIFLIIAAIFLILSWRYNNLKERAFVPVSLQFITSCTCFAFALGFKLWGWIGFFVHRKKAKQLEMEE